MTHWIPWWIAAYLLGSLPFGLLIGLLQGVDIRHHGSGNIGATNAWRVLGKKSGALSFILDFLKGLAPTLAAGLATGAIANPAISAPTAWAWLAVPALAILGHMFSIFLRFKGGKGVATGFGALLAVVPWLTLPALIALATWLLALRAWKTVSLASCLAALSLPISLPLLALAASRLGPWSLTSVWPFEVVAILLAALVLLKHRSNIARLRAGTEPTVGANPHPRG